MSANIYTNNILKVLKSDIRALNSYCRTNRQERGEKMKKIRLSAGHGAGTVHNRGGVLFNEGDENLLFTDLLRKELEAYDVDVKEIRNERGRNTDWNLRARSDFGAGAELFYSSHSNAGGGTGVEVFLSYKSLDYYNFANRLTKVISNTLGIANRGVKFKDYNTGRFETRKTAHKNKTDWFGELRGNKAKCAILVEHFFHDNQSDSRKYLANKSKLAKNIAKLISEEFGLELKTSKRTEIANSNIRYDLISDTPIFMNANDAKYDRNRRGIYHRGNYYIYKQHEGMINITKRAGTAGAWINPRLVAKNSIKVGDRVKVRNGARSYEGAGIASFVYRNRYRVDELNGNRAVLDRRGINTAFNINDLIK